MIKPNSRIIVAGAGGMVGRAIVGKLNSLGFSDILVPGRQDLDLTEQDAVRRFFQETRPEVVVHSAARVGGILANDKNRAEFIYENLMIEANVIDAAFRSGVEKLIFLGSSCIYPRSADQPIREESLLSGSLESTNEPYAIAKIAGVKMCESYFRQYGCNFYSVMPTNLYGPFDNFNSFSSHVIPALIRKFHFAKSAGDDHVAVWGSGKPRREFLHVNDLAAAVVMLFEDVDATEVYDQGVSHLNIGSGSDLTIAELAQMVKPVIGFEGDIRYEVDKPDGTPRKLLDSTRISRFGWSPTIDLLDGLTDTYGWFRQNLDILEG